MIGIKCEKKLDETLKELDSSTAAAPIFKHLAVSNLKDLISIRGRCKALPILDPLLVSLLKYSFVPPAISLREISWTGSSGEVIEFVALNDRVRPVEDWSEIKKRLEGNLFKCFGIFHDKMTLPVCFVFISFHKGIPKKIQRVLDKSLNNYNTNDTSVQDTCVFYSITSPFRGLNCIDFGNTLIKNVAYKVKAENPNIVNFVTLSPIPFFRKWLKERSVDKSKGDDLLDLKPEELEAHRDELIKLCKEYLREDSESKKRKASDCLDPVSRFHLRNGAQLGDDIHFDADRSERGFKESYGMMINYIYTL